MGAKIDDITPAHEPIALARDMVERAPGARAGVAVLIDKDGCLWYNMAGHRRADVLWALQRMIHILISDTPE